MATPEITRQDALVVIQHPINLFIKRSMDILVALIGIIFLLPPALILAVCIRLDSPGTVFFLQERVGRGGRRFWIYKFRTMHRDGEELLWQTMSGNARLRISFEQYQKLWNDPRLTRIGRWMRKTSVDELPQLINVLRGEMSLVGPRPILPEQIALYGNGFPVYICARPGMTGLWQVSGRNLLSFTERARLDLDYISRWSLALDVKILMRTVGVVLRGDGAC
jgi:lipopolysaccharide/colanic/teichoic acid biosynthesis glycosyltransferase